jgi:hypothetical protein
MERPRGDARYPSRDREIIVTDRAALARRAKPDPLIDGQC